MEKEKRRAKKLYLNPSNETHLSFHLSVLLRPELYAWFYENFINITILGESDQSIEFIDNFVDYSYRELMEERVVYRYDDFPDKSGIIDYLIKSIDNGFYSYMFLDKYCIPDTDSYMSWHFVHQIIAYGYDDINKTISAVDFSFEKGVVIHEISYENFIEGFINIGEYYMLGGGAKPLEENIMSFKPNYKTTINVKDNTFELDRFMSELQDYINSTVNISKIRKIYFHTDDMKFGIAVYDKLIKSLEKLQQGTVERVIRFKHLSDICLHKKYIYNRLRYINENFEIKPECREKIEEYKEVPILWQQAKSSCLKQNIIDKKSFAEFSHNPKFLSKFIQILKEAEIIEKETLRYIYGSLKKYAVSKSKTQNIIKKEDYETEYSSDKKTIKIQLNNSELIECIEIMSSGAKFNNDSIKKIHFDDGDEIVIYERQYNILHKDRIEFKPKIIKWFEYCEAENNTDPEYLKNLDFYIYKLPDKIYWDFWASQYIYCERKIDETVPYDYINKPINYFKVIGNDPNIIYNVNFDADKLKYVYIKYKTSCLEECAALFFGTYENPVFSGSYIKVFTLSPNDRSYEYILDMSKTAGWNGIVKKLRFDPAECENIYEDGECFIEYIEISGRMPVYSSEKDYLKTHGVNGWSYHTKHQEITYREMIWDEVQKTWTAFNDNNVMISPNTQTSTKYVSSVRRWTCPAAGKYVIKYRYEQKINEDNKSDEKSAYFAFSRNHITIENTSCNEKDKILAGKYELEMDIETGEMLNFEFYNEIENTVETIDIDIFIEKIT